MQKRSLLAVLEDESIYDSLREAAPEGCECTLASMPATAMAIARESKPDIVVVGSDLLGEGPEGFCRRLRRAFPIEPLQVLFFCLDCESGVRALAAGFDEVILAEYSRAAYGLRLRAAFQRLAMQESLLREREYYRDAVAREESLSSRLLDEHIALKETLEVISTAKRSLENANRRLEQAASRDSLSGLLNRASLFERLRHETTRAEADERTLSGILLDIDYFKAVNDSFGHLAGDEVIREFGKRMLDHLRKGDFAGRYGGEEFFIILPETDCERAAATAERIREGLADLPFGVGELDLKVTASLGVAERKMGETVEEWISRADRAMYRAKQLGRNRVCADELLASELDPRTEASTSNHGDKPRFGASSQDFE